MTAESFLITCPVCGSTVESTSLPPRVTPDSVERLRQITKSNTLSDVLSLCEICMQRLQPEYIQTSYAVKEAVGDLQQSFISVFSTIRDGQLAFINELRSADESKIRKLVDEFVTKQTELQAKQSKDFLARLDSVRAIDAERMKDYTALVQAVSEIRERLMGTGIGDAGEVVTVLDLKKTCPWDHFSEVKSKARGTDIVATAIDKGVQCGQVSISVKYDSRWQDTFIDQLSKNMEQDGSRSGILVTKAFPREALNPRFFVTSDSIGHNILVVKPELAPLAYFVAREVVIHWKEITTALEMRGQVREQEARIREAIEEWLSGTEFETVVRSILDAQHELEEMGSATSGMREYLMERVRRVDDHRSKVLAHLARCYARLEGLQRLLQESRQLLNDRLSGDVKNDSSGKEA